MKKIWSIELPTNRFKYLPKFSIQIASNKQPVWQTNQWMWNFEIFTRRKTIDL